MNKEAFNENQPLKYLTDKYKCSLDSPMSSTRNKQKLIKEQKKE